MKRTEYKFNGKIVCVVDESPWNAECAFFRQGGLSTRCSSSNAHSLAKAYLIQLRGVTPPPGE